MQKFLATGLCLAALSTPAFSNSCVPQQQAHRNMHVRTAHEAQSSSHRYVRVSEHRERMRADYQRMDDPYYEYYEERYAPAPRAGWWEWHPADDDYGPYYRW